MDTPVASGNGCSEGEPALSAVAEPCLKISSPSPAPKGNLAKCLISVSLVFNPVKNDTDISQKCV